MSNNDNLEIRLHHAVLPATLKGQVTKPTLGLDDKAFVYKPAIQTDLASTFARAREQLGARRVA